jgi:plasmid stability protein
MPTLYVENVPDDLYRALRTRARQNRKSIAAEVLSLLEENVPTASELRRRRALFRRMQQLGARKPTTSGPFPHMEEMLREDRER